jgi:hypothetical protein
MEGNVTYVPKLPMIMELAVGGAVGEAQPSGRTSISRPVSVAIGHGAKSENISQSRHLIIEATIQLSAP